MSPRPVPKPPTFAPRCGHLRKSGTYCLSAVMLPGHRCTLHRVQRWDLLRAVEPAVLDLAAERHVEAFPREYDLTATVAVARHVVTLCAAFGAAEVWVPRDSVGAEVGFSASTVRDSLQRLVGIGWLARVRPPDREAWEGRAVYRCEAAADYLRHNPVEWPPAETWAAS